MISRHLKATYYKLLGLPMWANGKFYKRFRAPRTGLVKVHLGPGQEKYLPGWINVDANLLTAKIDVWANLIDGLPFKDGTVDAFYSHHVIEHLPDCDLVPHFREMYRCLKPGGVIRVGGPNGDAAARKLVEGDASWFSDWPDHRTSVGGRYANFILCRGEHLTILTLSYLNEIATGVGFVDARQCLPRRETHFPALVDGAVLATEDPDPRDPPITLMVEAQKPGA